jgi:photosystem II stability/assembly factor-like uncharacterized protein
MQHPLQRRPQRLAVLSCAALLALAAAGPDFPPASPSTWLLPDPDLYGVDARGPLAWAVGYWGSIFRSDDGGETWEHVPTPTDASLFDVAFGDDRNGWAVGAAGTLLRSEDGGRKWRKVPVEVVDPFDGSLRPLDSPLFGVAAVSATEAWAVGDFGVVLHTRDGRSWMQVVISEETFADENIPDRILNAVHFSDRDNGWIAGEFGTLLRTTDGGETWVGERQLEGATADVYLFDVAANGAGWALAGGIGGVALDSSDGGASWQTLATGTSAGLFGAAVHGDQGILAGDRGVLLVSTDAGRSWREAERPRSFNWLRGAAYAGDGLAYVVGEEGLILRSSDGGRSWAWRLGRKPPPKGGISVPEPGPRTQPTHTPADAAE